jgi:hypothetical protein
LVIHVLYSSAAKGNTVLRISINDQKPMATLTVEGKLVGPWAMELGKTWHELYAPLGQKPLRVDLRGLTFVDASGTRILKEIVEATGAEIFADSPLTHEFANRVRQEREETK